MREPSDLPPYLSQWTLKELRHYCDDPGVLRLYDLAPFDVINEVQKRLAQSEKRRKSYHRRLSDKLEWAGAEAARFGNYTLAEWKIQLPVLIRNTAALRAGPYQTCKESVRRAVLRYERQALIGDFDARLACVPAIGVFCYYRLIRDRLDAKEANERLSRLWWRIELYRRAIQRGEAY